MNTKSTWGGSRPNAGRKAIKAEPRPEPQIFDSQGFVPAESRREMRQRYPWFERHYQYVVKVDGGYHGFETWDDYRTWKNQK